MSREKHRNRKSGISGLLFVGCLLIALAIGILINQVAITILIGLGVGFIAMAVARYATGEW